MAHNLNTNKVTGKVSMAYTGEKPWHSLGTKVDHAMTAAEVVELAGLDYKVEKRPLFLADGKEVSDHFATVRTDTNDVLGVVGNRYEIFQNRNGLSLLDAIVGVKDAIYQTAGALGLGERVWLLAKLPGYVRTVGDDVTEKFILLSNSHDGSSPIEIMFTPIRVVCQNTLNVALKNFSKRASLRHTLNVGAKIEEVRQVLGIVSQQYSIFEDASKALLEVKLNKDSFKEYLQKSGVIPSKDDKDQSTRASNILDEVSALFQNGKGTEIPGVRGTLWGAFNAVAEYTDHHRGNDLEKRANSLLYGSGALMKQRAWDNALALVK